MPFREADAQDDFAGLEAGAWRAAMSFDITLYIHAIAAAGGYSFKHWGKRAIECLSRRARK